MGTDVPTDDAAPIEADDPVEEVARRASGGDGVALRELLRIVLARRLAERPVRTVLLDDADVDDAVQGTLIKVAENISDFEGRSRFTAWLHRIARNEALMIVRRRARLSEPEPAVLPEQEASSRRLSSLVADEQTLGALLAELPAEFRQVIVLREHEGRSYDEIADKLGVPVGTVRSRLSRARRLLAERLVELRHETDASGGPPPPGQ